MRERLSPVNKILDNKLAAVAGGLLTVHRDANFGHIAVQAIIDGVILAMTFGPELNGRPDLRTAVLLLGSRILSNGLRYMDRQASQK